ncbi:hypothetical protein LIER_32682 [Lithospermum erythrorhizon]
MLVNIVDGNKLMSHLISVDFVWKIQGHKFHTTVRILPLGACQMVVGVDWLQHHSPVQFNFQKMQLTLFADTSKLTLQAATTQADLQMILAKTLTKWIKHSNTHSINQLFSLQASNANASNSIPHYHSAITPLIHQFLDLFTPPTELLPSRNTDHTINLKPEVIPQ